MSQSFNESVSQKSDREKRAREAAASDVKVCALSSASGSKHTAGFVHELGSSPNVNLIVRLSLSLHSRFVVV